MKKDKRKGQERIPKDYNKYLTEAQKRSLRQLRNFGWILFAIRRPLFQEPTVIVANVDSKKYGVMSKDGMVDYFPDIKIRPEEAQYLKVVKKPQEGAVQDIPSFNLCKFTQD